MIVTRDVDDGTLTSSLIPDREFGSVARSGGAKRIGRRSLSVAFAEESSERERGPGTPALPVANTSPCCFPFFPSVMS